MKTLQESLAKTNRVLIVEEDNRTGGWGAEVASRLSEAAFYDLDAPIVRLAAPDTPLPCAHPLELEYVPSVERIIDGARQVMKA